MNETITTILGSVIVALSLIPPDELTDYVEECRDIVQASHLFGPMTNPTQWIEHEHKGTFKKAYVELEIYDMLLAARNAIERYQAHE